MAQTIATQRGRKTKAARLLEAQRALEMHAAGMEDVYICEELKISRATLYRRIEWARSIVIDPLVEEYRQEAALRIRASRRRVYRTLEETTPATETILTEDGIAIVAVVHPDTREPIMVPKVTPAEVAALTTALVRLEDTEAKLRGGYAPTQVNVKHTVEDAFEKLMGELERNDPRPAQTQETTA